MRLKVCHLPHRRIWPDYREAGGGHRQRGITRNRLSSLTGVQYSIIDRYYKGKRIERADLDFLAKVCYVLDCRVEELLEYQKPEEADKAPE